MSDFLQATTKMPAQFLTVLYWSSNTDKRLFTDKAGMRSSQNSGYFNIKKSLGRRLFLVSFFRR